MSSSYISAELRRHVARRADGICEYCLIHEDDTFFGCEVDHIISEKHGGAMKAGNLAYACVFCNRHKGSDIGSVMEDGDLVRFFHPRKDGWVDHFVLDGSVVSPQTAIGAVTVRILQMNTPDRMLEREALRDVGRYPSAEARAYISSQ